MKQDTRSFEEKFRSRIAPDTSGWKEHPAIDQGGRAEFLRSQRVAERILQFLDENSDWDRQRLADRLKVSVQRISTILKGRENFTLKTIASMEHILGINLLDETPPKVSFDVSMEEGHKEFTNYIAQSHDLGSFYGEVSFFNWKAMTTPQRGLPFFNAINFETGERVSELAGEEHFAEAA